MNRKSKHTDIESTEQIRALLVEEAARLLLKSADEQAPFRARLAMIDRQVSRMSPSMKDLRAR